MSPDPELSDDTTIEPPQTITKPGGFFILAKAQTAPVEQEDGSVQNQTRVLIQDPGQAETNNGIAELTLEEFGERFSGRIVALASRAELAAKQRLGACQTVEIKTGKRKMIQYLLAPLQEYQDESLRER